MKYKKEKVVKEKLKVENYITHDLDFLQDWSQNDPQVFMNWIIQNGWHRRIAMRGSDLEKIRFIRKWMQKKEKPTITCAQTNLMNIMK